MLFKALEGLWPVYGGRGRYPGMYRWTDHLDPAKLAPARYGYHLAGGEGVTRMLGPDIYEAEPCPDHEPVDSYGFTITCRVKLVRMTSWNRVALSQVKAGQLVGKGFDSLPIQLRWDWETSMPAYIQDWLRPGVKGFLGHDAEGSIDAWIRGRNRQRIYGWAHANHIDRLLEALKGEVSVPA